MSNEKKYTREEIKAIVDEEIARLKGTKELSPNEMGQAAGGDVYYAQTHEEIDEYWDLIQRTKDKFGTDAAEQIAFSLHLINMDSCGTIKGDLVHFTIPELRNAMHRMLDGEKAGRAR